MHPPSHGRSAQAALPPRGRALLAAFALLAMGAGLAGCGLVAFPVRTSSALVKTVPVAGHAVAAPLDATAEIID